MTRTVLGIAVVFVLSAAALVGGLATGAGVVHPQLPTQPIRGGSFADIVARVNPSVVHIAVVERPGFVSEDDDEDDDPAPQHPGPRRGEGSGFVIDRQGDVLTNHHLVDGARRIRVRLADKRELPATLVGSDPSTDLALVKVPALDVDPIPMGDSDGLRVGDWVCAIGNPYSFDHSVTVGVVSSKGRKIWDQSFDAYIQTDAAINPGNSGGPLLNADGEVVGINAAVSTEGQGIGFAIPINVAKTILGQLRSNGHVSRGYLGIQLQELEPDLRPLVGVRDGHGAVVLDVLPGSAGEDAGLERYDVITDVSGLPIEDGDHLVQAIAAKPPGSSVKLRVLRNGRPLSLEAHLAERAAANAVEPAASAEPASSKGDAVGLVVADLSRKMKSELRIPGDRVGVVVRDVVGISPGIDPVTHGDIVVEVNRKPTPDVAAYRKALATLKPGDFAWLFVYRPRPASSFLAKAEVEAPAR